MLRYTERFLRTAKKLPSYIQEDLIRVINQIEHPSAREPFHVYPLEGRFRGLSALTVNFAYHAIVISSEEGVIFLDIAQRMTT
jgi:Flp pilus assembly CpaE family ATPase